MKDLTKKTSIFYISIIIFLLLALTGSVAYSSLASGGIKNSLSELQSNQERLQNNASALTAKNNSLSGELNAVKSELDAVKKEAEALKLRNSSLEQELKSINNQKTVYLTFDDGPSPVTLRILKTLKEHKVPATFFVIGNTKYPQYMKNIVNEGHAIALHTYSHDYADVYKSTDAYFADLNKISALVKEQTGKDAKIIRFPGGSSNKVSKSYSNGIMTALTAEVQKRGYTYYDWNVDSDDAGTGGSAEKLLKNIKERSKGKQQICLLMHDAAAKSSTADALPAIIKYYKEQGYTFAPLGDFAPPFHHTVLN